MPPAARLRCAWVPTKLITNFAVSRGAVTHQAHVLPMLLTPASCTHRYATGTCGTAERIEWHTIDTTYLKTNARPEIQGHLFPGTAQLDTSGARVDYEPWASLGDMIFMGDASSIRGIHAKVRHCGGGCALCLACSPAPLTYLLLLPPRQALGPGGLVVRQPRGDMLLASPVDFVAVPGEGGEQEFTLWKPVPPPGEAHIDGGRGNQTQSLHVLRLTALHWCGSRVQGSGPKGGTCGKEARPGIACLCARGLCAPVR